MTIRIARRIALCVAIALAAASPASAKHKAHAEPAHNYVDFDLTPSVPAPPAHGYRDTLMLLDSASATRDGDNVSFDMLMLSLAVSTDPRYLSAPPASYTLTAQSSPLQPPTLVNPEPEFRFTDFAAASRSTWSWQRGRSRITATSMNVT